MDTIRAAFALTPDYLATPEAGRVRNLMDTGVQLGRRFRALKLWAVLRYFGAAGIRARLAEHMRLARLFADWVDASADFERLAPVPLSVVCFRARPRGWQEPGGRPAGRPPRAPQRPGAGSGQRLGRGVPVAHAESTGASRCAWRSATSARRSTTSSAPGPSSSRRRPTTGPDRRPASHTASPGHPHGARYSSDVQVACAILAAHGCRGRLARSAAGRHHRQLHHPAARRLSSRSPWPGSSACTWPG